ncbi:MAG: 23S rRNA (guanosine(2251)-2'-O)-methyltransferase RlmB, partial [Candidatus Sumerlaeota bacterium]
GSHQRSWLWGRRAVMEVLKHRRWPINQLYLGENLSDEERNQVARAAIDMGVTVQVEPPKRLRELCHNRQHQGFLARMSPFPYTAFNQLIGLIAAPNQPAQPLVAVLDAVQDPYNFGAILRSAEVLGVRATLVGTQGQVGVNSHVARSSAGAVNRIPICCETNLTQAVSRLKSRGFEIVGASEKADDTPCTDFNFDRPVALILGNEGKGISQPLLEQCDAMVSVPQSGEIGSLNVAVAASILFYEAQRRKRIKSLETETDNEQRDV